MELVGLTRTSDSGGYESAPTFGNAIAFTRQQMVMFHKVGDEPGPGREGISTEQADNLRTFFFMAVVLGIGLYIVNK